MSLLAAALAAFIVSSPQDGTSWIAPQDGAFDDPANWTSGAPNNQTWAGFGVAPGGPFTVSLSGAQACTGFIVSTQALILQGAARDASLTPEYVNVKGGGLAALTVRDCTLHCLNGMGVGSWSDAGAMMTIGDGTTLISQGVWTGYLSTLEISAHSTATVSDSFGADGTVRWIIDGAAAGFVDVGFWTDLRGPVRIAFGPNGPPPPGMVLPLVAFAEGCTTVAGDVALETNGRVIDGVVAVEDDVLVYRQLIEPLQFDIDVPPMSSPGFHAFVNITGIGDGRTFDLTRQATLTSSDPRILQVVGPNELLAMAPGRATLTASLASSSGSISLTIGDEPLPFSPVDDGSCDGAGFGGMSDDARFAAFTSGAALTPDDTNGKGDVFVRDMTTGEIERVSEGPNGEQGSADSGDSAAPIISGDGLVVAFQTDAPEFVGVTDVFVVKDRVSGTVELIAVKPDGTPDLVEIRDVRLSFDGRFVAFSSESNDLVPGLPGFSERAYVRDRETGTTMLAGIAPDGSPLLNCRAGAISADGRLIAVRGYTPGSFGNTLFVRDVVAGMTTNEEIHGIHAYDGDPIDISDDGRYVVAAVGKDWDVSIELRDRVAHTTTIIASELENAIAGPWVAMSANGRYLAYHEDRFVPCAPGYFQGIDAWRYDIALGTQQRVNERAGNPPLSYTGGRLSLSVDGRYCAFLGELDDLMPIDDPCHSILVRRFGPVDGADIDSDGTVNGDDLALLISAWGTNDASADLDGDGVVGPADLTILLGTWTP